MSTRLTRPKRFVRNVVTFGVSLDKQLAKDLEERLDRLQARFSARHLGRSAYLQTLVRADLDQHIIEELFAADAQDRKSAA